MPLSRVTIRIPMFTNVPEDVVTNTIYVQTDGAELTGPEQTSLITALSGLYNTAFAGGMMSPVMVTSGARVLVYRMADVEPRTPYVDAVLPMNSSIEGTQGYVEEAAAVLSFQAVRISGLSQARRRGRIYLGCLSSSAIAPGSQTQFSTLISTFRNQIASAASSFRTALEGAGLAWVIYSPTNQNWNTIADGWIDVNPDTQRRRGQRAPQRTLWA